MDIYNPHPELFLNNKFTNCYFFIIRKAQKSGRQKTSAVDPNYVYFESHHIIPRALGGLDDSDNLVLLTAYEHFVCHWLLTNMCVSGQHRYKMLIPLNCMINQNRLPHLKNMAQIYESTKQDIAKAISEMKSGYRYSDEVRKTWYLRNLGSRNGMYGKKHSAETLEKMREAKRGANNPNANGLSEEHKRKIGLAHKGKTISEENKRAFAERSRGNKYAVKPILITLPDGSEIRVTNRKEFCQEYGYTISDISIALRKGEYKDIKIRRA